MKIKSTEKTSKDSNKVIENDSLEIKKLKKGISQKL